MLMQTRTLAAPERKQFPHDFVWGVATSSYQIEGAANTDGRGPSIWDVFCEKTGAIADGSDGQFACDHYHRWEQDLDMIAALGVNAYRFSISWSRVQPLGHGAWNEAGFAFYERLIEGLVARGLQVHITLNHWDLPQALQDAGGWASRDTCAHFVRYALEVVRRFGPHTRSLCTHNEPWVIAVLGHELGIFAPGLKCRKTAMQVMHHLLLSHGMAVKAIREAGGQMELGIVLNLSPIYPASDSQEDVAKSIIDDGLNARLYLDALYKKQYPADILSHLGSDAPLVEEGDMEAIAQPLDFLGVNYYTRNFSSSGNPWDVAMTGNEVTDMGWEVYPQGLTELLLRLHQDYPVKRLRVTENGAAFKDELHNGAVDDERRQAYLQSHILATWQAHQQGVPVDAYFAWSLMDNFEWASGYAKRFGLVYVDYPTQTRILKRSAHWYSHFLKA
jgi:beta-glucosidase